MARVLNSFKVRLEDKILDYRLGEKLNLDKIKSFFQSSYNVKKLWNGNRHVLGILAKNNVDYFLKLSSSEGISVVTENEYYWNNYFNQYAPRNTHYIVPQNYSSGLYEGKYFYLITDYLDGKLLCEIGDIGEKASCLSEYIPRVIELSELIQQLPFVEFANSKYGESDYLARFIDKVKAWFSDIPDDVCKEFNIEVLLRIVEEGVSELFGKSRHGDFAPWHVIKLQDKKIGLIDGEHFLANGVEGYDICYFIQRVFSVLKNPSLAKDIYSQLKEKGYQVDKLKTVLAARAIGGFLDESLKEKSDYEYAKNFQDWVTKLV